MKHAIAIPKLGLTMEEAILLEWHHENYQHVARGDTLMTIETDKVVFDVEAEQEGFLQRVAAADATLPVGGLAGYLHDTVEAAKAAENGSAGAADTANRSTEIEVPEVTAPVPSPATPQALHPALPTAATAPGSGRLMISPVARSLAQVEHVELDRLKGTGPGGVILKRDVEFAARSRPGAHAGAANQADTASPADKPPAGVELPAAPGAVLRRPLTAMRKAIGERMTRSLATTAQMTGFGKVDMTEAVKLRSALVAVADHIGVRITYTDIVLKAAAGVLVQMPGINSSIEGNEVVTWDGVNIGMAVSVEGGLMVPVIRHADRLSLVEVSKTRLALIEKARAGKLARDDIEGATFTVSNFGSYGGDFETPILNPPQSALLGIGRIADEPVVRDGQIVIRPMMPISLTFDHRLIDGAMAGEFRSRLKALLEAPAPSRAKPG